MADWNWMSQGGVLMDSSGDISLTNDLTGIAQLVVSRVKASSTSWQLYSFGADLYSIVGSVVNSATEALVVKNINNSLTSQFLPSGTFQIKTLSSGNTIQAYIFLSSTLLATAVISADGSVTVQANQ